MLKTILASCKFALHAQRRSCLLQATGTCRRHWGNGAAGASGTPAVHVAGRGEPVLSSKQPAQAVQPEEPAPMLEVLPRAPNIPSDPSFKLPEGMDPLSAVLLQKEPDQAPSEDESASEDGKDATRVDTTAPAVTSPSEATGREVLPPPPAAPPAAAGAAPASAMALSEAAPPAVPKLTPPPWAAAGADTPPTPAGNPGCSEETPDATHRTVPTLEAYGYACRLCAHLVWLLLQYV